MGEKWAGISAKIGAGLAPVFAGFVTPFFWGLIVWLVGAKVLKGNFPYMKAVEVVGLANMVSVLDVIVRTLLIVGLGNLYAAPSLVLLVKEFDPQNTVHSLLAAGECDDVLAAGGARHRVGPAQRRVVRQSRPVGLWRLGGLHRLFHRPGGPDAGRRSSGWADEAAGREAEARRTRPRETALAVKQNRFQPCLNKLTEMAKSKKRRKVLVFSIIAVVLLGLTALVIFKKREIVITVQTEKVARRNLTEFVMANGSIQPVLQVKISAEVSGEIIDLPVKEGQEGQQGRFAGEDQAGLLHRRHQPGQGQLQIRAGGQDDGRGHLAEGRSRVQTQPGLVPAQAGVGFRRSTKCRRPMMSPRRNWKARLHQVDVAKAAVDSAQDSLDKTTIVAPLSRDHQQAQFRGWASGCWARSRMWAPKS